MNINSNTSTTFTQFDSPQVLENDTSMIDDEGIVYVTIGLDEIDCDSGSTDADKSETSEIKNEQCENQTKTNIEATHTVEDDDETTLDALETDMISDGLEDLSRPFKLEYLDNGQKYFTQGSNCERIRGTGVETLEQGAKEEVCDSSKSDQTFLLTDDEPVAQYGAVVETSTSEETQYGTLMSDGSICLDSGQILGAKRPRGRRKGYGESFGKNSQKDSLHMCQLCGKSFTRKFSLHAHYSVHYETSPYICSVCGKNFTQVCHLKEHVMIHKGERPYACNSCDKTFTRISDLKRHKLLHMGVKLYSCGICGKQLSSKHGLQYHLRIHKGIRPFPCLRCEKRFAQKSVLSAHMKTHALSLDGDADAIQAHNPRPPIEDTSGLEFGCVEEEVDYQIDNIGEEIEI